MQNCTVPGNGGRGEEEVPPHSQWSFFPQSQWSQLHTVEFAPFRLTLPLTKFLPLAVIRGSPLGAGCALPFGKDSRAHRGRNSRLAHRARQDSASFRLSRQPTGLTFGSLPATSIVALLAWSASHCSFRLTHSGRFLLRRIAHWATASFVPLFHIEHRALQTSCRAKLLLLPFIYFQFHIARLQC